MDELRHGHRALYDAEAVRWDRDRARGLTERPWLDLLLAHVPVGGAVLDLGCGSGDPIAAYLLEQGRAVTGVDFSPAMLEIARRRFPAACWIEADMRALELDHPFHGIVGWDSFFHLSRDEQRALIPRLARHLLPGGGLLLTVGPQDGVALGEVGGRTVYHASLSPDEYRARLGTEGLEVERFDLDDPGCGGRCVLFAVASRAAGRVAG